MASYTKNLNLLKKDPVADGADTFNIETMLNENWDKIDENVATGAAMQAHITNQKNPHNVTAAQIGAAASVHSHTMGQVEGLNTALSNKADLVAGQVPYSQIPHLTGNVTIYVSATGNDNNQGTQESPFQTVQAAINSLPKDLDCNIATIYIIGDAIDSKEIRILGFHNGTIIIISSNTISNVPVKLSVAYCTAVVRLQNLKFQFSGVQDSYHIRIDSSYMVTLNSVTIDGVDGIPDGIKIEGQSNVGITSCSISNCNNAINSSVSSGTRGMASISSYLTSGENNTVAYNISMTILSLYNSTISAVTDIIQTMSTVIE